jgi:drug/metabolite transporter (DMT)-like permease
MPPIGVATGVLWFEEPLRSSLIAGGIVILFGLAVVVWPTRRAAAAAR